MDSGERVFAIISVAIFVGLLSSITYGCKQSRLIYQQTMDACLARQGSWVPHGDSGICIQGQGQSDAA